jgi:hypothetical protein
LDAVEARSFFEGHGVRLRLTSAYNLKINGMSERGHPLIINALVKVYKGKPKQWPRLLPFALLVDMTTHSTVIGYMPIELMLGYACRGFGTYLGILGMKRWHYKTETLRTLDTTT